MLWHGDREGTDSPPRVASLSWPGAGLRTGEVPVGTGEVRVGTGGGPRGDRERSAWEWGEVPVGMGEVHMGMGEVHMGMGRGPRGNGGRPTWG